MKFVADYTLEGIPQGTVKELATFMEASFFLSVDIETTGLCPHTSDIIMLQLGNEQEQFIIDCRCTELPNAVYAALESEDVLKVGANLKFEYKMFLGNWGIRLQNFEDVILQEMILLCGKQKSGFSLQKLTEKYLDRQMYKDVRLEFTTIGTQPFKHRHVKYGRDDILYPIKINELQKELIEKDQLKVVSRLENKYSKCVSEMEFHGIFYDQKRWLELYRENLKKFRETEKALDTYVIENNLYPFIGSLDLFTNERTCVIEWSSQQQVVPLFKYLGVPTRIIDKDKTLEAAEKFGMDIDIYKDSIGKVEIEKYAKKYPLVHLYLEYKKYQKAVTTYGEEWVHKYTNLKTNRVHTNMWQILSTGRSSSSNPNIQQIPSYKSPDRPTSEAHRTCFIAPEGSKLIVRDYSGQELRILADLSGEESMIEEFVHGSGDLHSLTASKVYSKIRKEHVPVSKKTGENIHLRHVGKTLNFAISYGASAYKISKGLGISKEEGQEIIDSFFESFPGLDKFFKKGHKFVLKNGYILIDRITGRRSYYEYFEDFVEKEHYLKAVKREDRERGTKTKISKRFWSEFFSAKGEMERNSQNYRIQGLAASMTKAAMVMLYDELLKKDLLDEVKMILVLHDEIVLEATDKHSEYADKLLSECMVNAGRIFCPNVPMKTDGGISQVWDH
jgi:DNA polymerase-1